MWLLELQYPVTSNVKLNKLMEHLLILVGFFLTVKAMLVILGVALMYKVSLRESGYLNLEK